MTPCVVLRPEDRRAKESVLAMARQQLGAVQAVIDRLTRELEADDDARRHAAERQPRIIYLQLRS